MIHLYELRNIGPSDASAVRFFVLIPQAIFKNMKLLKVQKILVSKEEFLIIFVSIKLTSYKVYPKTKKTNLLLYIQVIRNPPPPKKIVYKLLQMFFQFCKLFLEIAKILYPMKLIF